MTPNEILNKRFSKAAVGGYRVEEVHTFLANVSDHLEQVEHDRDDLERKLLFLAEKIEEYRADEESLRAALVNAQKTGEIVVQEAKDEANKLLTQAKEQSESLTSEARKQTDSLLSSAKLKVDTEAYTLNRMQMEVSKFRGQVLHMYEKQVELINAIPFDDAILAEPMVRPAGLSKEPTHRTESVIETEEISIITVEIAEKETSIASVLESDKKATKHTKPDDAKEHDEGFQLSDN